MTSMTRQSSRLTRLHVAVAAVSVLTLAAACGVEASTEEPGAEPQAQVEAPPAGGAGADDAWRLAVYTNQSGAFAPSARDAIQGVRLAVQEVNEEGGIAGRPINIEEYDTATDPTRATRLAESLQVDDDLIGVIGPEGTATALAAKPVLADKGVLQYANTGFFIPGQDGAAGDFSPYYFSTHGPTVYGAATAFMEWSEQQGFETMGLLRSDDASGTLYSSVVNAQIGNSTLELVGEEVFPVDAVNVSAQINNIASADPDVIYIGTTGPGLATALQAVQDLGLEQPVWAGWGSTTAPVAQLVSDRLPTGGLFSYGEAVHVFEELPEGENEQVADQVERLNEIAPAWEAAFGNGPTFDGAAAYDMVYILAMAVEGAGNADPAQVSAYLENDLEPYTGIAYNYDFSPEDHRGIEGSGLIIRFTEDGGFEFVDSLR